MHSWTSSATTCWASGPELNPTMSLIKQTWSLATAGSVDQMPACWAGSNRSAPSSSWPGDRYEDQVAGDVVELLERQNCPHSPLVDDPIGDLLVRDPPLRVAHRRFVDQWGHTGERDRSVTGVPTPIRLPGLHSTTARTGSRVSWYSGLSKHAFGFVFKAGEVGDLFERDLPFAVVGPADGKRDGGCDVVEQRHCLVVVPSARR